MIISKQDLHINGNNILAKEAITDGAFDQYLKNINPFSWKDMPKGASGWNSGFQKIMCSILALGAVALAFSGLIALGSLIFGSILGTGGVSGLGIAAAIIGGTMALAAIPPAMYGVGKAIAKGVKIDHGEINPSKVLEKVNNDISTFVDRLQNRLDLGIGKNCVSKDVNDFVNSVQSVLRSKLKDSDVVAKVMDRFRSNLVSSLVHIAVFQIDAGGDLKLSRNQITYQSPEKFTLEDLTAKLNSYVESAQPTAAEFNLINERITAKIKDLAIRSVDAIEGMSQDRYDAAKTAIVTAENYFNPVCDSSSGKVADIIVDPDAAHLAAKLSTQGVLDLEIKAKDVLGSLQQIEQKFQERIKSQERSVSGRGV
jgi:hypothetical protein